LKVEVWAGAWAPFFLALLILSVPGAIVAAAAGLRSMTAVALAPLLSISVLSVSAIAAPFVGLPWNAVAVIVGTLLTAGATWVLRVVIAKRLGWRTAEIRWAYALTPATAIGIAGGSAVLLYRLARIFGSPNFVSQTADNVFHLNAVRYIMESSSASSLTVGGAGGNGPSFYPAAWHGIAALIVESSGVSIPEAVACLNLVIGAMVWPLSMWFLCRSLFGDSTALNVGFAVLISSFSAFPYLLVDWGVLYPNYLGMAALPAIAGVGLLLCRAGSLSSKRGIMLPWLGLIGLAGISLSHPNSVICLIVILVPRLVLRAVGQTKFAVLASRSVKRPVFKIVAALGLAAAISAAWIILRPFPFTSFNITWPPYQSSAQAIGEALFTTHSEKGAAWATGFLLIVGLSLALTHRGYRWLAGSFLFWTLLLVAATAWQPSALRAFLTGGWFDDYKRIAAGLVLVSLPLALLGFIALFRIVSRYIGRLKWASRGLQVAASLALIAGPVLLIAHTGAIRTASVDASSNYSLGPGSPILSADEFKLYESLSTVVKDDEVIAGNPWDGSAWAYFVSGKHVLYPHVLAAMNPDEELIAKSLNTAASSPAVCAAARRLHIGYAINSDELIYLPGNPNNQAYPGLEGLDKAPGFQLVAEVGANRLYKLVAC
jgi:hypothetical protein